MPISELQLPDQNYFNIGETSRLTQTPPHTLRYWEAEFKLLRPVRRESGHRRYTRKDLEVILTIKDLLQNQKMTLAGAKKALWEQKRGAAKAAVDGAGADKGVLSEIRRELSQIIDEFLR